MEDRSRDAAHRMNFIGNNLRAIPITRAHTLTSFSLANAIAWHVGAYGRKNVFCYLTKNISSGTSSTAEICTRIGWAMGDVWAPLTISAPGRLAALLLSFTKHKHRTRDIIGSAIHMSLPRQAPPCQMTKRMPTWMVRAHMANSNTPYWQHTACWSLEFRIYVFVESRSRWVNIRVVNARRPSAYHTHLAHGRPCIEVVYAHISECFSADKRLSFLNGRILVWGAKYLLLSIRCQNINNLQAGLRRWQGEA